MDLELLRYRAEIIRKTRAFFDQKNYLETDTPVLAPDLIPESCLEVFGTSYIPPEGSSARKPRPYWLVPSPEIWMKRLIADHRQSIYQIGKCFRNGESTGRLHSPEFTMLEYYTMDADYRDSLAITEELFSRLLPEDAPEDLRPPFLRISMEEAFSRWAGFSLYDAAAEGPRAMEDEARKLGLDPPPGMGLEALYNLIFVHAVEPALPGDRPAALTDYPAFVPCLARRAQDGKTMERWELYVRGIELANCYSEETDPGTVREFFTAEGAEKNKSAMVPHGIDSDYWKTFLPRKGPGGAELPYPRCSGVALGMDRLIMALAGRKTIDSVLPFPMD
ncbi:amino acid--tRNA ligase-related protein [Breznakiella homolactica]|uniref:LysR family transcriptional regulator n=1 Tax=Breznakiella homolactica TaxID=2798577 RepID=A0A7T8BBS7_9SPIR|nr:amino acid--tRNA ligase-related protein [Breznakiella homolactica]QQO10892.1 LysR family transcriptional regulator [Breznakiella homolactica]